MSKSHNINLIESEMLDLVNVIESIQSDLFEQLDGREHSDSLCFTAEPMISGREAKVLEKIRAQITAKID